MKIAAVLLFAVIPFQSMFAQGLWQTIWGSEQYTGLKKSDLPEDLPYRIMPAKGGWFVLGTNSHGDGEPRKDTVGTWVSKFDANGKQLWWANLMPHAGQGYAQAVPTSDGGLFTADVPESYVNPYLRVIQLGPDGKLVSKTDTKPDALCAGKSCAKTLERPRLIIKTQRGFAVVLIAGLTLETRETRADGKTVIRTLTEQRYVQVNLDENKKITNMELLDITDPIRQNWEDDNGKDRVHSAGDSLIFTTWYKKKPGILVRKVTKGKIVWSKTIPTTEAYPSLSETVTPEGALLLFIRSGKTGKVILLDAKGSIVSDTPGNFDHVNRDMRRTPDGNYVCVSGAEGNSTIVKFAPTGKILFTKDIKVPATSLIDVDPLDDGGFVILAYTKIFGAWYIDGLLIRMDKAGNMGPAPRRP